MPRECIPQDEFVWLETKPHEYAPYNCCRRFGKPVRTFLRFAGATRLDVGKNLIRLDPVTLLFSKQNSFGGHRYAAEVTAAVPKGFANYHELRLAEPFAKVS